MGIGERNDGNAENKGENVRNWMGMWEINVRMRKIWGGRLAMQTIETGN